MYIHKISKWQRILQSEYRDTLINRIHAPTKGNAGTKYERVQLKLWAV